MENMTNDFLQSANHSITQEEAEKRFADAVKEIDANKDMLEELSNGKGEDGISAVATSRSVVSSMTRSYSNSPLVSYTCYSPNHSGARQHAIDTITIHEVWGECSMRALGDIFLPVSRQASSNYGVCTDGIALFVSEANRAWTSGSWENDNRAVTIETSNSRTYPNPVSDAVYKRLIDLCADICKRNGKTKMVWCGSLAATNARKFAPNEMRMTLHKWFQATDCPGVWLEQHMQDIANKVNAKLGAKDGWVKENGKWYYYENNKKVTGWKKVDGRWYYMDAAGVMQTGWIVEKKNKYYCGKNGAMLTGWQTIGGDRYYFAPGDSGRMQTGWIQVENKWYYANKDGVIQTGWIKLKGKKYYLKPSDKGAMVTGWFKGKEMWRYFKANGVYSASISKKYKPYQAKVTADDLNIRKNASVDYDIVGELKKGAIVTIVKTKVGKDKRTWGLLAEYFEHKNGWVAVKYTMPIN